MPVKINLDKAEAVIEGTKLALTCKVEVPPGGKQPAPEQVHGLWTIECDHLSDTEKTIPFRVTSGAAVEHEIVTKPLPRNEKGYYGLKYKVTVNKINYGEGQYAVFPESLHITARYKHKGTIPRPTRQVGGASTEYADGDLVEGVAIQVEQGEVSPIVHTESTGTVEVPLREAAAARVVVKPPWVLTAPLKGSLYDLPRNRVIEVHCMPYTVEIVSQERAGKTKENPFRHYVNCTQNHAENTGERAQICVRARQAAGASGKPRPGDKIFFKVTFSAENSKRSTPTPHVIAKGKAVKPKARVNPGEGERVFEGNVAMEDEEARFEVELGLAGGDLCKIEVGTTDACADDTTWIQTWRKLTYEIDQPQYTGPNRATDHTWVGTTGFPAVIESHVNDAFAQAFVEFVCEDQRFYGTTDLPDNGEHNVFDLGLLEPGESGRVVALSFKDVNEHLIKTRAKLRNLSTSVTIVVVDHLLSMEPLHFGGNFTEEREFNPGLTMLPMMTEVRDNLGRGAYPITEVKWKASKYRDSSSWRTIVMDYDPGAAYTEWRTLTARADIEQMIEICGGNRLKLRFPEGPQFPGAMRQPDGKLMVDGHEIEIRVVIAGYGGVQADAGQARLGELVLCTRVVADKPIAIANLIVHELGHAMGMTWLSSARISDGDLERYGRDPEFDIPGLEPPKQVPDGVYYVGRGHNGRHCSTGIPPLRVYERNFGNLPHSCVMFGELGREGNSKLFYCDECKKNLKAEDLRNVRRNWLQA